MKHLIKIESVAHGVVSVKHEGRDSQYCEAGETVKIKWQPDAGWGLQKVHYTDGGGNVVAIEGGEFVMPDSAVVIGATFKRFFLGDWADNPYNPHPQPAEQKCLTFTAGEGGASVGFIVYNIGSYEIPETYTKPSLQYSTDGGKTWQDYDLQISDTTENATVIELAEGASVMFKGVNENLAYYLEEDDGWFYMKAYIDGSVAASGDVTSLLNGVGGDVAVPEHCYENLFSNCTGLTQAPALPATELANYCYNSMFAGCANLITAPELPATELADGCYMSMFSECVSLTTAPELPVTTLTDNCYDAMFSGCTSLTQAPALPATTLAKYCYTNMFSRCTSLATAPELPATTLADGCYSYMFLGCSGLTSAPVLPATTLAESCYGYMFSKCTSLATAPELPATELADYCYEYMFEGCTGLTSAPELPATTLAANCYQIMFSECTSLTTAPELPATTLTAKCYQSMFTGCTSLTTAPELPATTLAANCYDGMFAGCTSLSTAPELPATELAGYCYEYMFEDCTGITSHDVATLNEAYGMFDNNTSCSSFTIHDDTPPTITPDTITGLKADCIIYVPSASVDAYKAAQYWSARAAYIQAIP
jgi:hypothetical protein